MSYLAEDMRSDAQNFPRPGEPFRKHGVSAHRSGCATTCPRMEDYQLVGWILLHLEDPWLKECRRACSLCSVCQVGKMSHDCNYVIGPKRAGKRGEHVITGMLSGQQLHQ